MDMDGVLHLPQFMEQPNELWHYLTTKTAWDERMAARKTASYGEAYNYSQMSYPHQEFPGVIKALTIALEAVIGFRPNNCLLNYYLDGNAKMGYHSDQTDILQAATGIAIISVGSTRTLQFRNIQQPAERFSYDLISGSLLYMTQEIQHKWQHAILKSNTQEGRISLTFRQIKRGAGL